MREQHSDAPNVESSERIRPDLRQVRLTTRVGRFGTGSVRKHNCATNRGCPGGRRISTQTHVRSGSIRPSRSKRRRYDSHLFGVGADNHHRCVGGQFVERLKPHLQPSHVPREQVMRTIVQFESRQIDDQDKQINVHLLMKAKPQCMSEAKTRHAQPALRSQTSPVPYRKSLPAQRLFRIIARAAALDVLREATNVLILLPSFS